MLLYVILLLFFYEQWQKINGKKKELQSVRDACGLK